MSKQYVGENWGDGVYVVTGSKRRRLDPKFDLLARCRDGFAWGVTVHPGADQLAFAILYDHLKNEAHAKATYMRIKHRVVGHLPKQFTLSTEEIDRHLADMARIEIETRHQTARVNRDQPVVMSEGGPGITWDRVDKITPNKREN